jgi:hypothetical protein
MSFVQNGLGYKIDVKIANPRNSTSPNAKAFHEKEAEADMAKDLFTLHSMNRNESNDLGTKDKSYSNSRSRKYGQRDYAKNRQTNTSKPNPVKQATSVYGLNSYSHQNSLNPDFMTSSERFYHEFANKNEVYK